MVGSLGSDSKEVVSVDTKATLTHAGLTRVDNPNDPPNITADGFQFLLMDTSSQVWLFVLKFLETVESKGLSLTDCLTFLFQLSFSTLGQVKRQFC